MTMPKKSASYDDFISQQLREDPEFAMHYLNEAQQTNDPHALFVAIRRVVDAQFGMTEMEEQTGFKRQSLYKMLSDKGNPGWISMVTVLHSLGLTIEFKRNRKTGKPRAKREKQKAEDSKPTPPRASASGKKSTARKKAL
jgi:probable addiction module antidote protein